MYTACSGMLTGHPHDHRPVASSFKLVRPGSGCGNKVGVSVGVDKMLINKYINMYMLIKNYKTVILKILQIYQCGAQSN